MAAAAAAGAQQQPRGPSAPPAYKYQSAMRTPGQGMQPGQGGTSIQAGQEPLSASALAAAHPNDQKQMLGERLFPLIHVRTKLGLNFFYLTIICNMKFIYILFKLYRRSIQLWLEKSPACCWKWTILKFFICLKIGMF